MPTPAPAHAQRQHHHQQQQQPARQLPPRTAHASPAGHEDGPPRQQLGGQGPLPGQYHPQHRDHDGGHRRRRPLGQHSQNHQRYQHHQLQKQQMRGQDPYGGQQRMPVMLQQAEQVLPAGPPVDPSLPHASAAAFAVRQTTIPDSLAPYVGGTAAMCGGAPVNPHRPSAFHPLSSTFTVMVHGLKADFTLVELRDRFKQYGDVQRVWSAESVGLVTYLHPQQAEAAMRMEEAREGDTLFAPEEVSMQQSGAENAGLRACLVTACPYSAAPLGALKRGDAKYWRCSVCHNTNRRSDDTCQAARCGFSQELSDAEWTAWSERCINDASRDDNAASQRRGELWDVALCSVALQKQRQQQQTQGDSAAAGTPAAPERAGEAAPEGAPAAPAAAPAAAAGRASTADGPTASGATTDAPGPPHCLVASNLPEQVSEEQVGHVFQRYGLVQAVHVLRPSCSADQGAEAHVQYSGPDALERAVEYENGRVLQGPGGVPHRVRVHRIINSFVVNITPCEGLWHPPGDERARLDLLQTAADAFGAELGLLRWLKASPRVLQAAFGTLRSVLVVISRFDHRPWAGRPVRVQLAACPDSKWPCLKCCVINPPPAGSSPPAAPPGPNGDPTAGEPQCAECGAPRPDFSALHLPKAWVLALQSLAQLRVQKQQEAHLHQQQLRQKQLAAAQQQAAMRLEQRRAAAAAAQDAQIAQSTEAALSGDSPAPELLSGVSPCDSPAAEASSPPPLRAHSPLSALSEREDPADGAGEPHHSVLAALALVDADSPPRPPAPAAAAGLGAWADPLLLPCGAAGDPRAAGFPDGGAAPAGCLMPPAMLQGAPAQPPPPPPPPAEQLRCDPGGGSVLELLSRATGQPSSELQRDYSVARADDSAAAAAAAQQDAPGAPTSASRAPPAPQSEHGVPAPASGSSLGGRAAAAAEADAEEEEEEGDVPPGAACESCGRSGHTLKVCGGCRSAYFCDERCQREVWERHKPTCRATQQHRLRAIEMERGHPAHAAEGRGSSDRRRAPRRDEPHQDYHRDDYGYGRYSDRERDRGDWDWDWGSGGRDGDWGESRGGWGSGRGGGGWDYGYERREYEPRDPRADGHHRRSDWQERGYQQQSQTARGRQFHGDRGSGGQGSWGRGGQRGSGGHHSRRK